MSDKKKLDNEIEQELDDRLEDGQDVLEQDDDFTVKVHREDYTVKRRFYDKGKALETADSLRKDKENVVEDNIDNEFTTPVEEDEAVDWDKLVDGGLDFYPPISDAAEKKLEDASNVAGELAAESALVGDGLDITMSMESMKKIKYPKIEPKSKLVGKKTSEIAAIEIDEEMLGEDILDILDEEVIDEDVIEEDSIEEDSIEEDAIEEDAIEEDSIEEDSIEEDSIEEGAIEEGAIEEDVIEEDVIVASEKNKYAKSGSPVKKIMALCVVIIAVAGLYYFLNIPPKVSNTIPVVNKQSVVQKKIVETEGSVSQPVPVKVDTVVETDKVEVVEEEVAEVEAVEEEVVEVEAAPKPAQPEVGIPEITKHYPYTIHISSYKSQEKAASEVVRIRKKGYDAFSAFIEIPGKGVWRRIYTGYFEDYTKATAGVNELKTKMREDAIVAKTLFGVQLGLIAEKKDLVELANQLQAKGYSVYYLPVADGKYVRLLAGAYKKESDASGLLEKLVEDGFDAAIVKR